MTRISQHVGLRKFQTERNATIEQQLYMMESNTIKYSFNIENWQTQFHNNKRKIKTMKINVVNVNKCF